MNNVQILRIGFVGVMCLLAYIVLNTFVTLQNIGPKNPTQTTSVTPIEPTLVRTKTDKIVTQIISYDNNTKKLKLKLFPLIQTDCSTIVGVCTEFGIDNTQATEGTIDIPANFVFKFATPSNENCTSAHINTDLRSGTINDLVKSKCNYIGSYSYFLAVYNSANIVELDEYIFPNI